MSGRVGLDGQPVEGLTIAFQPLMGGSGVEGPGSSAKRDANGQYVLELVTDSRSGAVLGGHCVTISAPPVIEPPTPTNPPPRRSSCPRHVATAACDSRSLRRGLQRPIFGLQADSRASRCRRTAAGLLSRLDELGGSVL